MGLFSTVLHLYKKSQGDIVNELSKDLRQAHDVGKFSKIDFTNENYQIVLDNEVYSKKGVFYLITQPHGDWTTIIELNVNIADPFYLYDLTNSLSKRLDRYGLSFHLHNNDVLIYNLDKQGESMDGYNSSYQYFITGPVDREEVLTQRHSPQPFSLVMPATKNVESLNEILNEGYWTAFDNNKLDEDGVPDDDKYFIDEEDRFIRICKYLEIFSKDDYPFANWHSYLPKINLADCYLLKAEK